MRDIFIAALAALVREASERIGATMTYSRFFAVRGVVAALLLNKCRRIPPSATPAGLCVFVCPCGTTQTGCRASHILALSAVCPHTCSGSVRFIIACYLGLFPAQCQSRRQDRHGRIRHEQVQCLRYAWAQLPLIVLVADGQGVADGIGQKLQDGRLRSKAAAL